MRAAIRTLKILGYMIQGGLAALVCIGLGLFVAGKFAIIAPYNAYVILSGSMAPTIPVGGVVLSQAQTSYTVGDIVSFVQGSKTTVTHRITSVTEADVYFADATYTTKGDANKTDDSGSVSQSSVQGKVLIAVPYLGYLVEYAKSPKGFLALVIIPATIIIYEELKNVRKELANALGRFFVRLKKPKNGTGAIWPQVAIVPIVGAAFLFVGAAGAYFLDAEASLGNILGAASSFGEKTATIYDSSPFTCSDGASSTTTSFGFVVIKLDGSTVKVDVKLVGATPSAPYDLWVNQNPGGCPLSSPTDPAGLTTDGSGNGLKHVETPRVVGATKFWISAVGGGQVLRSVAVTL